MAQPKGTIRPVVFVLGLMVAVVPPALAHLNDDPGSGFDRPALARSRSLSLNRLNRGSVQSN